MRRNDWTIRLAMAVMCGVLSVAWAAATADADEPTANTVTFEMPRDGHATIAINDAEGKRVRNLLADMPFEAGEHSVEWDGRDDSGEPVDPGTYEWVGLVRDDVHAVYRGSFQHGNPPWPHGQTGGWIADHSPAVTVVRVDDRMVLGATESEWGHGLIASDLEGQKLWGVKHMVRRGWAGADMLAEDGGRVFATSYMGQKTAWEIDPQTGENHLVLEEGDIPEQYRDGGGGDRASGGLRLVGAHDGEVYFNQLFADEPRTLVYKADDEQFGKLTYDRALPVQPWHLAWLSDGRCVAVLDTTIEVLDTETGETTPLVTDGLSQPHSIAVDEQDRIYVSDQGATGVHRRTRHGQLPWRYMRLDGPPSHQIKTFNDEGEQLAAIGKEGGQKVGKFNSEAFFMPAGLAVDAEGRLWVTEMNYAPKRVTVWSIPENLGDDEPALEEEFLGPTLYGGGAAMIDPERPWLLMDTPYGHVFDVNLEDDTFHVHSLPWRHHDPWKEQGYRHELPFTGRPGVMFKVDGRKFSATQGGYMHGSDAQWHPTRFYGSGGTMIGEYVENDEGVEVFVPRAGIGNLRMWMRGRELNVRREEQWMPEPILEAAKQLPEWEQYAEQMGMDPDADDVPHVKHERGSADWIVHPWPVEISGFIWTDANDDQEIQPDEIAFHEMGDTEVITLDDDLNVYFSSSNRPDAPIEGTWTLPRQGFNDVGAPVYTWETMEKITDRPLGVVDVGPDGSLLSRTALHTAEGERIWSYPSDHRGVRALGPDAMETLKPGRIHRVNASWGVVEGPGELGEVYMLKNVDGMVYLLTREDGLFITSLFRPYAFADGWDSIPEEEDGIVLDEYSLQDESFNGHFARAEASGQGFEAGHYYMLGLSRSAVVEVTGLDGVERLPGGEVRLVEGEGLYGEGEQHDPADTGASLAIQRSVDPLKAREIEPGRDPFADAKPAKWLSNTVRAAWRGDGLHMKWEMRGDNSPLVNEEHDVTQLFATGDAADLHVDSPTLGPLRFIITMHRDEPVIVRMRYEGEPTDDAVTYRSGVAETEVAEVTTLDARPNLRRIDGGWVAQFHLPWSALGVEEPEAGLELPIEMGVISSDATGSNASSRNYWSSGASEMVADVPTEARPVETGGVLILAE